jgi:hypothetical protein
MAAIVDFMPRQSNRLLMAGVLANSRTLKGLANRWPNRYPDVNSIAAIFPSHPSVLNLVHYNTEEPESLCQQLLELTRLGGPNLHGYQLNIAWPSITELSSYRRQFPEMNVVLQIGQKSIEVVDCSAQNLVDKLGQEYAGLVDYILLDLSAGYGIPLNPQWAAENLKVLQEANLGVGFGVAGGLSAPTLDLLAPLINDFPDLSIDAESLLRDKDDRLDIDQAKDYIDTALKLFSSPG